MTNQEMLAELDEHWGMLLDDWDGDGALAPDRLSIEMVKNFLIIENSEANIDFELMATSGGRMSLFLNENDIYADIEFIPFRGIAFFIKKGEIKLKGTLPSNEGETIIGLLTAGA